jgi:limonene-1,2-epoxide hydrolase
MSSTERTASFFTRWSESYEQMCASFHDVFGAECVWDQRPLARTTGPDAAVRFLNLAHRTMGLATIDVEMLSIAAARDVVHTERIDHLRRANGRLIVAAPVAGVLTFRDGRLVHWREYFDAATFAGHTLGTAVGNVTRRARR